MSLNYQQLEKLKNLNINTIRSFVSIEVNGIYQWPIDQSEINHAEINELEINTDQNLLIHNSDYILPAEPESTEPELDDILFNNSDYIEDHLEPESRATRTNG